MDTKIRSNKKLITFSDRNLDMMDALMKETGWNTPTQLVRRGIEELYKQTFKYGKNPLDEAQTSDPKEVMVKKAVAKAEAKKVLKDQEELLKLEPKMNICTNLLGGEVETDENGYKYCVFTMFAPKEENDARQKLPIRQVDALLAETSLFTPSKEVVFKLRPDIKKKFSK